ncbi:MAG: hypothetical protein FWG50_13160 [Kiritimatiellaeota bacterium]|nr:hypothetical protein [Kiritimatiellota bacterium]
MMKKMMTSIVLSVGVCVAQGLAQTPVSDAEIEQACVALQKSPTDAKASQVVQGIAKDKAYPAALRSRAIAVCALAALAQHNTNQHVRIAALLQEEYPDERRLLRVTLEDCMVPCERCGGEGQQKVSCPTCLGSGKCKTCDGTGKRGTLQCTACKGNGVCARCAGAKKIVATCSECKGAMNIFKPSEKIAANLQSLLGAMLEEVRENIKAAEALRKKEDAWLINAPAAIQQLDAYLEANPHAAAQGGFDELKDKLRKRQMQHLAVIVLAGCVVLGIVVGILKATVFRPKPERLRRPPGLAAIDRSQFTDPLASERKGGKD